MVIVTIPLFVLGAGTGVPVWILAIAAVGLPVAGAFVFGRLFDTYILRVAARRAGGQPPR
jgi:TM2 domain-containing membrane protein YozV